MVITTVTDGLKENFFLMDYNLGENSVILTKYVQAVLGRK